MLNFTKFVQQAMPEVERVAMEMAEHFGATKKNRPMSEFFQCELISYYPDGRIYETSHHSTWAGDMQDIVDDSKRYRWTMKFDPETKVFTFEKHFSSNMYRIATYTPYDKDALDIAVEI